MRYTHVWSYDPINPHTLYNAAQDLELAFIAKNLLHRPALHMTKVCMMTAHTAHIWGVIGPYDHIWAYPMVR